MKLAFSTIVCLMAALAVGSWFAGVHAAAAQEVLAGSATADDWTPPRTPWGAPDLQGVWDSKTQTPLERPDELADKAFLTEEEVAALEKKTVESEGRDERAESGTVADVEGAYNNAFSTFLRDQGRRYWTHVAHRRSGGWQDPVYVRSAGARRS